MSSNPQNMPLNRRQAPPLHAIDTLNIATPHEFTLPNGIEVCWFEQVPAEVMQIKIVLPAGRWYQNQPCLANITNRMIREGTKKHNAEQLAEKVEFYGAVFRSGAYSHFAELTVNGLVKHLPMLLPVLAELATEPSFPENELQIVANNAAQRQTINLQRADFLADQAFNTQIWGNEHPYANQISPNDFLAITPKQCQQFFKQHYQLQNARIYLTGPLSTKDLALIEQYFGQNQQSSKANNKKQPTAETIAHQAQPASPGLHYIGRENNMQASIRVGLPLFNQTHPHYNGMLMLHTLLGGYFGSRLNQTLREERGLTYGVYSSISSYLQGGSFAVSTEARADAWQQVITEITAEVKAYHKQH
jgi:zinc protease